MIIFTYRIRNLSVDHRISSVIGPEGLVIFDHPHNAEYFRSRRLVISDINQLGFTSSVRRRVSL